MINFSWRRLVIPICLSLLLFISACAPQTSRYDEVQKETSGRGAPASVAKDAEQGSSFNKFFPRASQGYQVVPAQEKKGFAEYKLNNKDGKTVAMLSINDTISNPAAATKYEQSNTKVAGFPSVEQGSTGTGILVNGRYQVKVLSRDPAFTQEERVNWLQKFDLRGLAQLKTAQLTPSKSPKSAAPGRAPSLSPIPAT
ncbi:hypothetical protein GLO73106DRAFT_00010380 [Gloeocapsa sp. PCC 73106]|nr:hypothetical protein GLO73106DRAFT_00010380 [Gloeocapsa sp. PCC 73106]